MEEERNYLKEYYSVKEHDYKSALSIDIENEDKIKNLKSEIKTIGKMLEEKNIELHKELELIYSKNFVPTNKSIILSYSGRNGVNTYYDLDSGLQVYDNGNGTLYMLDTKVGEVNVVVGYNYELGSIIVNHYKYSINKDNDRITTKLLEEYVIPFMENKGAIVKVENGEVFTQANINWNIQFCLEKITDSQFINTMFGVDYKGNLNLKELKDRYYHNKSFEIIIKTAPTEIVDKLLKIDYGETMPIYKLIGISQETYNKAIERNLIVDLLDNINIINGKEKDNYKIDKTEKEWLDLIEEIKNYEEDLKFYGIEVGYQYYYHNYNRTLLSSLLYNYTSIDNNFKKYYTLGKFINYVISETINQGYTNITNFITELKDYLKMCESDNIVPTLYSSYLKQTHDITSRNHKIKVEKEGEEMFASRYKDFKTFKSGDYMVVAPKCSEDLKIEGDNLNHCVASYIKRVIDGSCLIYFLRKEENTSLITFEVRHNTIVQVRGLHNRKPNEQEIKALQDFANKREMEVNF